MRAKNITDGIFGVSTWEFSAALSMTEQLWTHSATLGKQIQKTTKSRSGYEVQQFSARLDLLLQMPNVPSDSSTLKPFLKKFLSPTLKTASQAQQILYTKVCACRHPQITRWTIKFPQVPLGSHTLMKTQGKLCELGNLWELDNLWKPSGVS